MRAVRYILVTLTLAIAGGIGGVLLLAATPAGFAWLAGNADRVVPGELTIAAPAGSLLTTLRAAEVRYALDDLRITAANPRVHLNWLALLATEVRLSKLHIDRLDVTYASPAGAETGGELPAVDLPLALRVVQGSVDELHLDIPGYRGAFSELRLRGALRGERLRLFELSGLVFGLPVQLSGELRMSEAWPYSGAINTRIAPDGLPEAQVQAGFAGDVTGIDVNDALVRTLDGTLAGSGKLTFADLSVEAEIRASEIDLPAWQPGLPALHSADLVVRGRLPDALQVVVSDAHLQQGERAARLAGTLEWDGTTLQTPGLQLAAEANRVDFSGTLYPSQRGRFTLTAPQPGTLLPGLQGVINGGGEVVYNSDGLQLNLAVTASALGWQGTITEAVELQIAGTPASFRFGLAARAEAGEARLEGNGSLGNELLALDIVSTTVQPVDLPDWELDGTLAVRVGLGAGTTSATLGAHCWMSAPWRICVDDAAWSPESIRLAAQLAPINLAELPALANLGYRVAGTASAELQLEGTPDNPAGRLIWRQQDTLLAWTDADGNTLETLFAEALAELQLRDRRLRLAARTASDTGVTLTATADTAPWQGLTTSVAGRLNAAVPDIALFAPLLDRFAALDDTSGELTAVLQVSGTLEQPLLTGEAELTDGRTLVRTLGIELTDILVDVTAAGSSGLAFEGSAVSGDGQLLLQGTAELDERGAPDARLTVRGDNVTLLRFPQQVVIASPDLQIGLAASVLSISGVLAIPSADITVEEVPAAATAPSRDAKVVRAAAPPRRADALLVISDVRLQLGDAVRFSAFGLQSRLGGQLRLLTTADNQLPYLEGNVRSLEGKFEAFGRELDIERGVLIFSGVPDNPNVDVRAVRKLRYEGQDVKIVVRLSGPLQAMQTSLTGEPAMSESDALSYLVLNRPARRNDTGETEQLSAAAMALGLINLLPQTETLRNRLGIDEIEFEGSTRETSAITAGKRIGEDFYIRYSYGLFERIGRFIIRYDMGSGFSLEAGSGQEQTIDLLYSIDR